jgi:hypothetical protein
MKFPFALTGRGIISVVAGKTMAFRLDEVAKNATILLLKRPVLINTDSLTP